MPVAVNGSNFGKIIIGKYEGVIYDLKNNFFYLFVPRSLSIRRTILPPQIMTQSTNFLYKT
jgi:hypothetical protein